MISRLTFSNYLAALALSVVPALALADMAHDWITKIQQSTGNNNYQGTFVYRQGDQMEVMRVVHRVGSDGIRERLFSLNGWAREIIRNNDEVVCYLPDKKAVMAGHRADKSLEQKFPIMLPENSAHLAKTYHIKVAKAERIAGRKTMLVSISPKDKFRYGYRLWADRDTGLLLKSDLLDERGRTLEQFMFTDIRIGSPVSDDDLKPTYADKGMAWQRVSRNTVADAMSSGWAVGDLPSGFMIAEKMVRNVPGKPRPVAHLVISDGLAAVSVFVEEKSQKAKSEKMVTGMGATHAFRASLNGHQVTAVGEVPAATVERIGGSVRKLP